MDFGFHPLYVVILVALALIIFGPSRLPKLGAQAGRMLREFQIAREGLTQQMREAFEEDSEPDFSSSTTVEEESESGPEFATADSEFATADSAVGVLDPPAEGLTAEEPETIGAVETPPAEKITGEPDVTAAGESPLLEEPVGEEPGTVAVPDASLGDAIAEEPETAAMPDPPVQPAAAQEPETATALDPALHERSGVAAGVEDEAATGSLPAEDTGLEASLPDAAPPRAPAAGAHQTPSHSDNEERPAE